MEFKHHPRHGLRALVPSPYKNAQRSVSTAYDNSFGVRGARLWNLLPKEVNEITELGLFKLSKQVSETYWRKFLILRP